MTLWPGSIRARLLIGLLLVGIGMNAALLSSSYRAARHEINELFDAQLAQSARVLEGVLAAGPDRADDRLRRTLVEHGWHGTSGDDRADDEGDEATADGHEYESKLAFQLLDGSGTIRARTLSAPERPFSGQTRGYDTVELAGYQWRVFVLPLSDGDGRIQVGQREDIRGELEGRIAWKTVQKSLYGLPLLALLVWLLVSVGLRPLSRLSATIGQRDESQLGPVSLAGTPRELQPIIRALNSLFERLRGAWARERRFIDEAAHELRTPLAAIQLHAESLSAERDPAMRERIIERLLDASNRGSRLASQLLTLARVESNEARVVLRPIALAPLLREEAALQAPLAARAHRAIELDAPADLPFVMAEPGLLGLMVRNLIENALRYTAEGSTVHIAVVPQGDHVSVRIVDEGPGIPRPARERAMARFSSLSDGRSGSGLGLAICSRIAEQHRSQVELLDRPDGQAGLCVQIRLIAASIQ
ncbi:ATP-binding protein [Salinisphaera sp. T31B1]|uniref:ATP-binding protein n=1 Tax=Salinisphaera sp. T31B1 TaxID=727963 RepID=UPI003340E4A3